MAVAVRMKDNETGAVVDMWTTDAKEALARPEKERRYEPADARSASLLGQPPPNDND